MIRPDPPMVGIQQIGLEGAVDEDEIQWRTAQMIARALNTRRVIGFVGSGLSMAYNLPSWESFARKVVKIALKKLEERPDASHVYALLADYVKPVKRTRQAQDVPALSETDRTLTVLGACDDAILEKFGRKRHAAFRKEVAAIIHKGERSLSPELADPLLEIIEKLEIRRFLTTNYDALIEGAFRRFANLPAEALEHNVDGRPEHTPNAESSTTRVRPLPQNFAFGVHGHGPDALLQFAVGSPGHELGVFHLHGVASNADSMIVTEGDYQRLYLQDDAWHRAYRDALSLAFSANPVLFLGVGLTEADLLRPLRQFVSEREGPRPERPLFALYEKPPSETRAAEWRRYLYARFGLKVLYYESNGGSKDQMTAAFCRAVNDLALRWLSWWRYWQQKPAIRKASFRTPYPKVMVRHETDTDRLLETTDDDRSIAGKIEEHVVVMALGQPGSGKGSLGLRLVKDPKLFGLEEKLTGQRFFATAHFTNDFLSMIQAAADYFDGKSGGESLQRLKHALTEGPHLFVLGGVERLLIPYNVAEKVETVSVFPLAVGHSKYPLPRGRPVSVEAEQFLQTMKELADKDAPGRVLLTSSVWPAMFDGTKIGRAFLSGVSLESILGKDKSDADSTPFRSISRELVKRLRTALGGHVYALAVVAKALEKMEGTEEQQVERLIARVTAMDLPRRTEKAIEFGLKALAPSGHGTKDRHSRSEDREADLREGVLERVALFSTPVPTTAVTFCYRETTGAASPEVTSDEVKAAIQALQDANLLLRIAGDTEHRLTAHTVVRTYVLQLLGCLPDSPGEAQRFRVGGFATEETEAEPGSEGGHHLISSSVDRLLNNIELSLRDNGPLHHENRQTIRAAFGLVRSRWTSTGVARLDRLLGDVTHRGSVPPYYQYRERLSRLINAVRLAKAGPEWTASIEQKPNEKGILYADELLWLYNELALSAFCQGSMADAYALFRMVQDVVEVVEPSNRGERWCQSEINLGLVQLERGWLRRARYHLENSLRFGHGLRQSDVKNQAIGFLGLVYHLSGDYARAKKQYEIAIDNLTNEGNGRALSIFLRHRGDLLRRIGALEDAERDVEASVAAAESGRYPDLLYYARLAQANIRRKKLRDLTAVNLVNEAARFARRVGLPKLEADAYIVNAQFALDQGDIDLAGRRSAEALAIASASRMGLRLTGALVLAARVADVRGYPAQARRILEATIQLGVRQGHQLRVEAAEQELMGLPRIN